MRLIVIAQILGAFTLAACGSSYDDAPATSTAPAPAATQSPETPAASTSPQPMLPVIELTHEGGVLFVEVARTAEERGAGLGGRPSLAGDAGMLFDLETTRVPSFSMRGMLFPLDLIWIDETMRVAEVTPDAQPEPGVAAGDRQSYSPSAAVRYVLEVNAGAAAALGIDAGDQLEFASE